MTRFSIEGGRTAAALALLLCLTGCAPQQSSAEAEPVTGLSPVSVLIVHRVADYDGWKLVFDGHAAAREAAGCSGHYLKRGIDDEAMVYVYCPASDEQRLRAFLESEELAEAMARAGVEGPPSINLMKLASRDLVSGRMLPGIIMMHSVDDYETWRADYDALDGFRAQSGIVGHAVARKLDDADDLVVYHQAEQLDDLRAFVASAELRQLMESSGAAADLEVHFIRVVDFASY
jgi:hypothetical protein